MAEHDRIYTKELGDRICALLANGMSLRNACRQDGMPDRETVFRWRRLDEEFRGQYDAARKEGAHAMVDDMQELADDESLDPNSRRIRVDTRKWIASKMMPKIYGEKIAVSGDEDGAPIQISWASDAQG